MNITTGAEIVLNWIKRYKEQNGEYPFASEIESQLTMAIEGEKQFRQAAVSGSLPHDPEICGCENHADYCPFNPNRIE